MRRERQVTPALPDDLVPGREADQVGEALDRHGVAVVHQVADGVVHASRPSGHPPAPPLTSVRRPSVLGPAQHAELVALGVAASRSRSCRPRRCTRACGHPASSRRSTSAAIDPLGRTSRCRRFFDRLRLGHGLEEHRPSGRPTARQEATRPRRRSRSELVAERRAPEVGDPERVGAVDRQRVERQRHGPSPTSRRSDRRRRPPRGSRAPRAPGPRGTRAAARCGSRRHRT